MASLADVTKFLVGDQDPSDWVFTVVERYLGGVQTLVPFEHGEIVLLNRRYGREIFGEERCPAKWHCHETEFAFLEEAEAYAAIARERGPQPFSSYSSS